MSIFNLTGIIFRSLSLRTHVSVCPVYLRRFHRCRSVNGQSAEFLQPISASRTCTDRTGLFTSAHVQWISRHFFHVDRCENRPVICRRFSSSTRARSDSVGKIETTHYHLCYTCKVVKTKNVNSNDCLVLNHMLSFGYNNSPI